MMLRCFGLSLTSLALGLSTLVGPGSRSTAFKGIFLGRFYPDIVGTLARRRTVPKKWRRTLPINSRGLCLKWAPQVDCLSWPIDNRSFTVTVMGRALNCFDANAPLKTKWLGQIGQQTNFPMPNLCWGINLETLILGNSFLSLDK